MRYRQSFEACFGECDPAGVLYYPRFFDWFHRTFETSFGPIFGLSYSKVLEEGVGYPSVQAVCEYRKPIAFGERVEVEMFLSRLSQRSMNLEFRVRAPDGLRSTGTVRVVAMSIAGRCAVDIPARIRQAFSGYVEVLDAEQPDLDRLR